MDEIKNNRFNRRLKTMLGVDFRRVRTSPFFYIMVGISFVIPILILVMTTLMDGSVSVNPQTGEETIIEGFKNVWQIIGTTNNSSGMVAMDITTMCNINLMYFIIAVFICVFVSDDFRSGYAKNLFAIRSKKTDYVVSKSITCFVAGACMIFAFIIGAMIGGKIMGLPFVLEGVTTANIIMCLLSKILIVGIFSSIYVFSGVVAKQKLWLSILISLGVASVFFTMIPMITPLNSTIVNVLLCLVGSAIFAVGIGIGSNLILKKTNIL